MDTFKKLNLIEKRKMAIEELVNYYAESIVITKEIN